MPRPWQTCEAMPRQMQSGMRVGWNGDGNELGTRHHLAEEVSNKSQAGSDEVIAAV